VVSGLVFGLIPALRAGAAGARATLAIDSRTSAGGRSRARSALVVADLALALVLLAGAGLMLRTAAALTRATPGFDADRVLTFQFSAGGNAYATDEQYVAYEQRVLERLRAIPGVESVALAGQIPFGGDGDCRGFHVKGRMKPNPVDDPCLERYGITPDYMRVMGIPLRAGRMINDADTTTSPPVLVVSESTARLVWGRDNPIGSEVRIGGADSGPWRTVVGVVGDVNHADLTEPPLAAFYNPQTQMPDAGVAVLRTAHADGAAVAPAARAAMRELDPAVPVYQVETLKVLVAKSSAQRLFIMRLLIAFAAVAVLLAAIGLYGVVSYGVAQRTRELGVRIALGAQRHDVLTLVLGGGAQLVAAGVVGGLAAAALATRFLGTLVFGVSPLDPLTFAAAAALLIVVALAAHLVPVRRALRIDPASALRAE
jgi:putative ABC transport system permease protein